MIKLMLTLKKIISKINKREQNFSYRVEANDTGCLLDKKLEMEELTVYQ